MYTNAPLGYSEGVSSPLSSLGVGEDIMDNRKLFGGAIEAQIPSRFIDVSDFRPVPDHQEVFSDEAADQSIIIEIVELSQTAEECPGRFYLKDLAAVNGAIEWAETSECEELGVSDSVPRLGGGEVASARVFCITGAMVVDTSAVMVKKGSDMGLRLYSGLFVCQTGIRMS